MRGKKRRIMCMLLSLWLVFGLCPDATAVQSGRLPFSDVPAGIWFENYVSYVYDNGLMNGTSATTFGPNENVSRGMFVTVLGRLDGIDPSTYTSSSFTDVKAGIYYAPYVEWAASMGLVNGKGGGIFDPDGSITREQMASIIARYVNSARLYLPESESPTDYFADAEQVSDYAQEGLELMRVSGLLQGSNGCFNPQDTATRAQAAAIFMRLNQAVAVDPAYCGGAIAGGGQGSACDTYSVAGLSILDGKIAADVCTEQPCVLVAEIQSVDGATLSRAAVRVAGGLGMEQVTVKISGAPPEHFLIAAVLRDEKGNNLSNTFVDRKYTKEYQDFMALTPEAPRFKGQTVVDFDGNDANNTTQTENFGVLAEGVRQINTDTLTLAEDGLSCTYTGGEIPQPDEVLYIVGANDKSTVVKVGSAKEQNGAVTVYAAESSTLSDYYQMLKVNIGGTGNAARSRDGEHKIDVNWKPPIHLSFGTEFELGALTPYVNVDYSAEIEIRYDPVIFGKSYLYFRFAEISIWESGVTVMKQISSDDLPQGMLEKDLCPPETIYTSVPGLTVQLQALGFVEFEFGSGTVLTTNSTQRKTYIHETGQPDQTSCVKDGSVTEATAETRFQIGFGGRLRLSAGLGLGGAENALGTGLNTEFKIEVEGKEKVKFIEANSDDSQYHDCDVCIDGAVNFVISCYADLRYHLNDLLKGDLVKVTIVEGTFQLKDFYITVVHDPSYNVFDRDGVSPFGLGKCPNVRYKTTVETVDAKGEPMSGVPVSVRDTKTGTPFAGSSPYTVYLLKGAHEFTAQFDGGQASKSYSVIRGGGSVQLKEPGATLYGTVEDTDGKGISGATVTVKQGGETVTAVTVGSNGGFSIEGLSPGSYTVTAAANGYSESDPLPVTLTADMFREVILTLRQTKAVEVNYERKYVRWNEYAIVTGIDENGNTCWTYTTPTYNSTQFFSSWGMGIHNDQYYLYLYHSIVALDLTDGSILWENTDFGGSADYENCYVFDEETGDLFVSGSFGPELCWISPEGETIALIKGDGVWGKPELSDGVITTHGADNTGAGPDTVYYNNQYKLSEIRGRIEK